MNVRELIAVLGEFDGDLEVRVVGNYSMEDEEVIGCVVVFDGDEKYLTFYTEV